jgi:ATP-dependent DNA helicase DinG
LIRDVADFGVVMLCDRRLVTKPYGRIFLKSLPSMPRTDLLEEVTSFLDAKLSTAGIRFMGSETISTPALPAI